ncbi:hypothetical protein MKQ70_12825 [Chitinophaga sedimenti]|uniref:hypothetical protein n=1 Tax=Chitinophaga sedimenti TaxID=2033606 RepID=UPI002006B704|nr:hypothetical protein [Chitinophaga sedimenti]MCK7555850.1 hypothetical protein [Chitinophaga sedimenti]
MRKHWNILTGCLLLTTFLSAQQPVKTVPLDSIRLSDPYILADKKTRRYYMTGTGGMLWTSPDLKLWTGPHKVAQTDSTSGWARGR